MPQTTFICAPETETVFKSGPEPQNVCDTVAYFPSVQNGECIISAIESCPYEFSMHFEECDFEELRFASTHGFKWMPIFLKSLEIIDRDFDLESYEICNCDFPEGTEVIKDCKEEEILTFVSQKLSSKSKVDYFFEFLRSKKKEWMPKKKDEKTGEVICGEWYEIQLIEGSFRELVKEKNYHLTFQAKLKLKKDQKPI